MSDRPATLDTIAGPDQMIEEVFLTPRVVDEGAFNHYSTELKELIREAGGRGQQLRDFRADARQLVKEADRTGGDLRKKLELGAKLLSAVDARIARLESMLGKADTLAQAEEKTQEIIDRKLAQLEAKAEQIEQRLRSADRAASTTAANLSMIATEIGDKSNEIERRIGAMTEKAEQTGELLGEAIGDVLAKVQAESEDLTELVGPLRQSVDQAFELMGVDPEHPDKAAGGLAALIERGEALAERAETTAGQLGKMRTLAEEATESFGAKIAETAGQMKQIEAQRAAFERESAPRIKQMFDETPALVAQVARAAGDLQRVQQAKGELDTQLGSMSESIAKAGTELQNQAQMFDALVAGSTRKLNEQVEQAGRWLNGMIERAEQAGKGAGQARGVAPIQSQPTPPSPPLPAAPIAQPHPAHEPAATRPPWQPRELNEITASPLISPVTPPVHQQPPAPQQPPADPAQRPVLRQPTRPIDGMEFSDQGNVFPKQQ